MLNDPSFTDSQPFARQFLEAMGQVQDFWQEPAYAQLLQAMQKRVHDYVVADQGTAQEALDQLVADWTEIFEDEGKLLTPCPGRPVPAGRPTRRRVTGAGPDRATHPSTAPPNAAARATPRGVGPAGARAVRPGDRLAVHRARRSSCCSRSTSSR